MFLLVLVQSPVLVLVLSHACLGTQLVRRVGEGRLGVLLSRNGEERRVGGRSSAALLNLDGQLPLRLGGLIVQDLLEGLMVQTRTDAGLPPVGLTSLLEELDQLVRGVSLNGAFQGRAPVLVFDVDGLLGRVSKEDPGDLAHAADLVSPALDGVMSVGVVSA